MIRENRDTPCNACGAVPTVLHFDGLDLHCCEVHAKELDETVVRIPEYREQDDLSTESRE